MKRRLAHRSAAPAASPARPRWTEPAGAGAPASRTWVEPAVPRPEKPGRAQWAWDARRALNVAVAAAGLLITLPLTAVIALLIKVTSPGPVLYTQWRVGLDRRGHLRRPDAWASMTAPPHLGNGRRTGHRNGNGHRNGDGPGERRNGDMGGRPFRIHKFRTMCQGSDAKGQVWARPGDPRITPVGRVLRRTRLDELPQLVNVLKGDMNVVGPRPEQPDIFAELEPKVSGYRHRQAVLPGITGWAQVNHSYDRDLEDVRKKVALDLEYIARASVLEDLRIMLRTPRVMAGRNGGW